jgi:hypothetical protein
MKVTLEAVVGFVARAQEKEKSTALTTTGATSKALVPRKAAEMTANDRRFLRSLRIAADDTKVEETDRPA